MNIVHLEALALFASFELIEAEVLALLCVFKLRWPGLKYDIVSERIPKSTQGDDKAGNGGYSKTRGLDSEKVLEHLPSLQQLLHSLMGWGLKEQLLLIGVETILLEEVKSATDNCNNKRVIRSGASGKGKHRSDIVLRKQMSPWKGNLPKLPIESNIVRLATTSIVALEALKVYSSILLLVVTVVIVAVILVVLVVAIVGVAIVVTIIGVVVEITIIGVVVAISGVSSIIKILFVIIGFLHRITIYYLLHQPLSYGNGFLQSLRF
ncbi:hypothetical protein Tco_0382087 [Tanacetum coccineum]